MMFEYDLYRKNISVVIITLKLKLYFQGAKGAVYEWQGLSRDFIFSILSALCKWTRYISPHQKL